MTTSKRGLCCSRSAFRKVRFSGHISTVLGPLTNAVYIQKSSFWPTDLHIRNEKKNVFLAEYLLKVAGKTKVVANGASTQPSKSVCPCIHPAIDTLQCFISSGCLIS